jgi:superfamily II DNA or RNA helicase
MAKILRIAANATTARIFDADKPALLEAHRLLSYRVEGAEHMPGYSASGSGWDGRASFFDYDSARFHAGFVQHVTKGLRAAGYEIQLVKKPLPPPLGPERPKVDDFPETERYAFHMRTVDQLVRHGQITAQIATGGGKSRIARLAYTRIGRRTLFLTTRGILMYQMHRAMEALTGAPVAVLGDGEWGIEYTLDGEKRRRITQFSVGMVQTLAARLRDPETAAKTRQVLEMFEFVVAEEAHEASGDSYFEVMDACKNAAYRLALTATSFMKDDAEANMRLMACGGPIGIRVTEKQLIDSGILARPYFKFLKVPEQHRPKRLYRSTPWQGAYRYGIVENEYRNKLLVAELARAVRYGLTGMALVKQKDHGKILRDMLTRVGVRAAFVWGESNQKERDREIARLGTGELDVLIGSTIMDVGVDCPAVGMIAIAGGGKDETGLRQRIGRGLREKKNGLPNVAFIVDVDDDFNTHLVTHARERQAIIRATPGFVEGIVNDFDYAGLGLTRLAA